MKPVSGDREYVFEPGRDRYPVAVHGILTDAAGCVLLIRRCGAGWGDGRLALPAGHVDLGETATAALVRELFEEVGIVFDAAVPVPAGVMFRLSAEPRVDLFFTAPVGEQVPVIREPEKCSELVWADPSALPADCLDYVPQAIADARDRVSFREFGWPEPDDQ